MGKAIDVLSEVGFRDIQAHEQKLNQRLIGGLKKLPNVVIYGDSENISDRVGVVTFNFNDTNSYLLAQELSKMGGVATPGWTDIVGADKYIKVSPTCPAAGSVSYTLPSGDTDVEEDETILQE